MTKGSAAKIIYGLIGYPVKHSLSPAMHNAAFQALKINAEYRLFEIKPEQLKVFFGRMDKNNICGLNVTVPYKERILDFVSFDSESFDLTHIKAVNTIVEKDGIWKGFNTDIPGFLRDLKEKIDPVDKRIAILGAGGAARAVTYVLANLGAKEIYIYDIDKKKSQELVNMVNELFPGFPILPVESVEQLDTRNKDLLINATPVGLSKTDPCLIRQEMLHKNLFVYDLIYNPAETKLLSLAEKMGARTANGLGMLLYQGMLSFEIWTGRKAPIEIMRQALKKQLKKC